jgi:hypothetical protein
MGEGQSEGRLEHRPVSSTSKSPSSDPRRAGFLYSTARLAYRRAESSQENASRSYVAKYRKSVKQTAGTCRAGEQTGAAGDYERRLQRLQETLDKLMASTDWKKL